MHRAGGRTRRQHRHLCRGALSPQRLHRPDCYQTLEPYGHSHFLCYDAKTRSIGLRRIPGAKDPAADKHGADEGGGGDGGDDTDDATDDMATDVENWLWYGYRSADEIDALIDRDAASSAFDVDRVKAFAVETLARKRATEAGWPQTTDCDKLDRVFARLQAQGICALQCAGDTLDDGYESVRDALSEEGVPDDRYMGYCFFHSQDIDHALDGEGLTLAFGYLDSDDAKDAIPVGRTICEALRQEGFEIDWNGSPKRRIGVPKLRWQRRTPG